MTDGDVVMRNFADNARTQSIIQESTPFKSKSQFLPPSNLNPAIVTCNQLVENDIAKILQKKVPVRMNLSDIELKALQILEKKLEYILQIKGAQWLLCVLNNMTKR